MSVDWSVCLNDTDALEAFRLRYPSGVDWNNPPADTEWPGLDPALMEKWDALSPDTQETLSLNTHNGGAATLMRALGYNLEDCIDGPSGRCNLHEFIGRCAAAEAHVTARIGTINGTDLRGRAVGVLCASTEDYYLGSHLQTLRLIATRALSEGFSHLSWG